MNSRKYHKYINFFYFNNNCFSILKQSMFVNKSNFAKLEMSWHFANGGIDVTQTTTLYYHAI